MKIKEGFRGQRAIVLPESIVALMQADLRTSDLFITDIGYYPNAEFHFRERNVGISQYVFIYCVNGSGWFEVKGDRKRVQKNQFFILPPDTPHAYSADSKDPWTIYWIHFKGNRAMTLCEPDMRYPNDIDPQADSRIEDRNQLFEEIYSTLEMGYSWENLHYANLCLHYYLASLLYIPLFRNNKKKEGGQSNDPVSLAIHYMRENIEKKIRVEEIAAYLNLSVSYFSAQFRKSTGYAPIAYLNALKIQLACKYLDFSDMKINQLCFKLGFDDAYYFSRIFTKTMGSSPSEYRRRVKG